MLTNYLLHYEEVFTFIFGNYDDYPIHYQTAQQRVYKIERECLAATTEANFETLNQVCNRKDEAALKRMIAAGQVYILTPSMTIRMVDHGFAKCKVYVVDLGIEVWVSTDFIEYK